MTVSLTQTLHFTVHHSSIVSTKLTHPSKLSAIETRLITNQTLQWEYREYWQVFIGCQELELSHPRLYWVCISLPVPYASDTPCVILKVICDRVGVGSGTDAK